jgi:phosphoribosylaminoimidazole (AIR) synthetase
MYRVFNMGIGLVVITPPDCDPGGVPGVEARLIGEVCAGEQRVSLPW